MAYSGGQQPTVVVVTQQPTQSGQPQNVREWSTGLCGCCTDCSSCCYAYCCYPCFLCTLASKMDEFYCGPHCCGCGIPYVPIGNVFLVALRTKLRAKHGIMGSICDDICCMCWCQFCAATQLYRELKHQEHV